RVVGTLLGASSAYPESHLRAAAEAAGLRLRVVRVTGEEEPVAAMKALLGDVDVVLAVPDAQVLTPNRAKWLLYMAYRRNTPVVGFSEPYVEAGALAALHATPRQVGRQAAERLARLKDHPSLGPPAFSRYFSITLNRFTARSLGIRLPEEVHLRRVVTDVEGESR
ncbi:MAG TPA: ABC transporter substrate binding protein, partial [Gammaproteobacteria bacterium]|nr:ABC transporter substrate binding protein [Gammaproteobacteria bacterium]